MGAALAIVPQEDLRTMAHDALDAWLDQLERETATPPTLRDLSERFLATRSQLLSACLETVIRQRYAADLAQTEAVCGCGRRLPRRRFDAKELEQARLRSGKPSRHGSRCRDCCQRLRSSL